MKKQPTVLVCPLDWGIGHATRCVPVIRELVKQGARVIIGASNRPLAFLKKEFPQLEFLNFPGFQVSYPTENKGMVIKMVRQLPTLLTSIKEEKSFLNKILSTHNIDLVISDNRYGLYTKKNPCVFITHQVFIKSPANLRFAESLLWKINKRFINKYTECWVPDFEHGPNLSGALSHKKPLMENTSFIGPLSRFSSEKNKEPTKYMYDVLVMLSGPEPQRTILENKIFTELTGLNIKAAMVCGKPEGAGKKTQKDNIDVFQHLESDKLQDLIQQSGIVVSRPGYSTVMDLAILGKKAMFIPTPGQTEQEYLGDYYTRKKLFYSVPQNELNLKEDLKKAMTFPGTYLENDHQILIQRISRLLSQL